MKEKYFKVTESMSDAVMSMDDKTAGKFIKSVCDYAFKGKSYDGGDSILRSNFALVKRVLDGQAMDKMYGKMGAKKSMELRKQQQSEKGEKVCVGRVIVGSGGAEEFIKDLLTTIGGENG